MFHFVVDVGTGTAESVDDFFHTESRGCFVVLIIVIPSSSVTRGSTGIVEVRSCVLLIVVLGVRVMMTMMVIVVVSVASRILLVVIVRFTIVIIGGIDGGGIGGAIVRSRSGRGRRFGRVVVVVF